MNIKTCPAQIKAAGTEDGADEGVFEAIVAAYNVDSVNDRIIPGAFKKSLDAWKTSGDPIPVLWAHKSDDPDYHIGQVLEAEERPEGLWVKARVDLDEPKSRKIFKLMKGRRIRSFSFSYDIVSAKPGKKDDGGDVQELHELHIHEIGPCLIPANRETNLIGVKNDVEPVDGQICDSCGEPGHLTCFDEKTSTIKTSDVVAALKDGRALSKEHVEALTGLLVDIAGKAEHLGDILDVLAGPETFSETEKATPAPPAPVPALEAKDETPARPGTASVHTPNTALLDVLDLERAVNTY